MGFNAVISKKSVNKSKKIAEHFAQWLKQDEAHQVIILYLIILSLLPKWK